MKPFATMSIAVILMLMVYRVFTQTSCGRCQCHADRNYEGGIKAVCSGLHLIKIPSFTRNTTTLLMDNNNLTNLPARAFAGIKTLKHLDLSDNIIYSLGQYVFYGLHQLEELILDGNNLLTKCVPVFDPVFLKPLMRLKSFSLLSQRFNCYNIKIFSVLYSGISFSHSLQSLYIDCKRCRFLQSFQRLTNLTLLSLASPRRGMVCSQYEMDNTTFMHTPYIESLNISDCQVVNVRPGTFDPLPNLRKLDMSIYLAEGDEFMIFMEATKSLQFSLIEYIKFVSFHSVQTNSDLFYYLQNTTLKQLEIVGTIYPLIEINTFKKLPQSLEVLIFKHFQYATSSIFTELKSHTSLKILDLSNAVKSYIATSGDLVAEVTIFRMSPVVETFVCKRCQCSFFLGAPAWSGPQLVPSEPPEIGIKHMKKVILPDNGIRYFAKYMMDKLPFLEYVDIRNNILETLVPFPQNNSIQYLNVAGNNLGHFLQSENTSTFKSLSKLEVVDFSDNRAFSLSTYGLDQLHNIQVINVSNNYLEVVNIRLSHLTSLKVLDLSYNKINAIGEDTRNDLSRLPKARVNLVGNPLVCGCDELDSLQWMKQNRKRVQNLKSLNCRLSTGKHESLSKLDDIITDLQTLCKSYTVEISVSVCVTVSVLSLVAGVLVYRHRWKLRYLYHAGRRGYRRRYNHEYIHLEDYQYDAFISYADPDRAFVFKEMVQELEEKHGLKLCVHHRDFLPGEVISDNIVNAIQNSRKTVVVLSPSFLKSDWCEFEFNMARMEGVTRRQDIVLMLLYEDVSMMNLSKDMASMLKRNCYLEYNHELFNKEIFWYNVQESIQTIRQKD